MVEIKWSEEMSVGEKTIDEQHKKLLETFNSLSTDIKDINVVGKVRNTLHFLNSYIKEHFTYEEAHMEKLGYTGLEKHKEIHETFVKFFEEFNEEFKAVMTSKNPSHTELQKLSEKAKVYLGEWLVNHIMKEDQKYVKSKSE